MDRLNSILEHQRDIDALTPLQPSIGVIIRKKQTKLDLVRYLHSSLLSLVNSTLITAIKKGFLITFPGLTADLVRKHLPVSDATVLGHRKQEKQGLQSTSASYSKTIQNI